MNTRIPRLLLAASSVQPDAISEASVAELIDRGSESTALSRLYLRLKTDEGLARDLQSGNPDALTELFRRHAPVLFHVARRILGNAAEAEDAVQQTFLDMFRSIQQFDPDKGPFKTWLFMFVYHRSFNHRRSLMASCFFTALPLDEAVCIEFSAHSQAEIRILINQALSRLPARERRTIELIYFAGLTAVEAAETTHETVRVVRHNLYRGLEKLRKIVFEQGRNGKEQSGGAQ